jgi:2-(1,2-epoxy-1,2-dihydrophenyl)acetyl-CoA isomerase
LTDPTDSVLVARENGVLTLTLNRPKFRNAMSREMTPLLTHLMREAQVDPAVRCVVVTGAGDHFTAGGDVSGFQRTLESSPEQRQEEFRGRLGKAAEMVEAFVDFDRPIVARVRGAVAGAGLMLTLVADLVLADETATFVFAHQRMALIPDCGVSWLLPRVVGLRQAKRLLLTAAMIGGAEALALGLLTSLHPTVDLDAAVAKAVAAFARAPQEAVKGTKRLLNDSLAATLGDQLKAERDAIAHCVGQDDFVEAVNAFLEKRPARFPSAP